MRKRNPWRMPRKKLVDEFISLLYDVHAKDRIEASTRISILIRGNDDSLTNDQRDRLFILQDVLQDDSFNK